MRNMQLDVAEPKRLRQRGRRECAKKIGDLLVARVLVAPFLPLDANAQPVLGQHLLVSSPHLYCRMVLPAVVLTRKCVENLECLNALLTQAASVKHSRGLMKLPVRKKCLHSPSWRPYVAPTHLRAPWKLGTCLSSRLN